MKRTLTLLAIAAALTTWSIAAASKHDVNPAVVQREDPAWQEAMAHVKEHRGPYNSIRRPVVRSGARRQKLLALTFDDGPFAGGSPPLLDELKQLDVKATFFVVGQQAERHQDLIRRMVEEGHEIENHSYSHVTLTKIPWDEMLTEYRACSDVIREITGQAPRFCRPPGGDLSKRVVRAGTAMGMRTVLWTSDPLDYSSPGVETIVDRVKKKASNGGIILLHVGAMETLDALPQIVTWARDLGYKFVTLDELQPNR